jgi:putative ABC transport system ATP-binding protein
MFLSTKGEHSMQTVQTLQSQNHTKTADDIIQVRKVTRELPLDGESLPILRGISFAIPRKAWIAIMGPSGSGKSTLLGILAGLDTPTTGQVVIDGVDITYMDEGKLARFRNEKIGVVFQNYNLIPTLSAIENVEVPLFASRNTANTAARARRMLELVKLDHRLHHRPSQLSGGEQQRVAIARALVNEPSILVGDEPTGNLDSKTGESILNLFAELRRELGITLVIATHDSAVAARVDGVLRIADGNLAEQAQ